MKKKTTIKYEIILGIIIILCILLPQLNGTTTVNDVSSEAGKDEYPVPAKSFKDLEAPGTRFGVLTGTDWNLEILKRFPSTDGGTGRQSFEFSCLAFRRSAAEDYHRPGPCHGSGYYPL